MDGAHPSHSHYPDLVTKEKEKKKEEQIEKLKKEGKRIRLIERKNENK